MNSLFLKKRLAILVGVTSVFALGNSCPAAPGTAAASGGAAHAAPRTGGTAAVATPTTGGTAANTAPASGGTAATGSTASSSTATSTPVPVGVQQPTIGQTPGTANGTTTTAPAGTTTTGAVTTTGTDAANTALPVATGGVIAATPGQATPTDRVLSTTAGASATSPTITGTVSGTAGKTYLVGANGLLYFRTATGLTEFGHIVTPTTPVTVNPTTTTPVSPMPVLPPKTHIITAPTPDIPPGLPTGILNSAKAGAATASPVISSTVMGNDGKTYYISSNGSLLYQGKDGGLHVFGSGAQE